MKRNIFSYLEGDKVIWISVIILSALSVLAVYSSTSALAFRKNDGNTEYYMLKQVGLLISGLFIMYVIHHVKFSYFSRIAQILFVISIPLLVYTLTQGAELNDANRWIKIPIIKLTFQSSDLAKLALILFVARALTVHSTKLGEWKSLVYSLFLPVFIIVGLIWPAHNSTAGLLLIICLVMLYFGGVPGKLLGKFSLYSAIAIVALLGFMMLVKPDSTRVSTLFSRVNTFFQNDIQENSQEEQAMIAIANGQLFGKLPGNSTQKNILPHPYSDFMFAFFIEEYGLFGAIVLLLLYSIIIYRGIRISIRAPGLFTGLAAMGITLLFASQAFINMLVGVHLFPVTGQPLPLLSMGGTSILFTCISLGMLLSISREVYNNKEEHQNVPTTV